MVHYPATSSQKRIIKGWTCSAAILRKDVAFKRSSIGIKGPKLCQENVPHTITPAAA